MKRLFCHLTNASGFMFCLSMVLFAISYSLRLVEFNDESRQHHSPHSVAVYFNVRCATFRGSLWLFSNGIPYTGSILYLSDREGTILYGNGRAIEEQQLRWQLGKYREIQFRFTAEDGSIVGVDTYGDLPRFRYRHFKGAMYPSPWWTVRCSLLYPIVLFGCLPGIRMIRIIVRRTRR